MSPFDFVKEIQTGKHDLMTDTQSEKDYVPFVINKTLSYEMDCILYANEMNRRHHLDKKLQFHYLLNIIRARKRPFHKWVKSTPHDSLEAIQTVFGYSRQKAQEAARLLTTEQLTELAYLTQTGGRVR